MTLKILAVTEATYLNTGYAVYFRELLKRLHANPAYDVAELACYASVNEGKIYEVPWKLYCNLPDENNQADIDNYNSNPNHQFGAWKFEAVCCDFKPNVVLSIRDYWMDSFIDMSPFRRLFKWIWMPTVDAAPQNNQWIDMYNRCDAILTYNDWSGEILLKQSGGKIKWAGSAPPIANENYIPRDKADIKAKLGFDPKCKIVGTVMRNQRRKLYPDLFAGFRKFLDVSQDNNVYLYCHTSYPDAGWDFPYYLKENNLCNKVMFTYICADCRQVFPSFFQDAVTFCPKCNHPSASMANVHLGASEEVMSHIYNLFDLYIQYANSEGFGVPLVEAASCGIPIAAINYSAMSDILTKLDGFSLNPIALQPELETGCLRAVPNKDELVDLLISFFNLDDAARKAVGERTLKLCKEEYSMDKTVDAWVNCFNQVRPDLQAWTAQPSIHNPAAQNLNFNNNKEYVKWLIVNVLGDPSKLNTFMELRTTKDLNFRSTLTSHAGMYSNDHAFTGNKPNYQPFGPDDAYKYMVGLCERRNFWEKQRCGIQ